jgi:uncharacterized membrane protein
MTSFLPEWAPNIHPLIVHFPIALLTTAVALHFLELIRPGCDKIKTISTALYLLGIVAGWAAFFAGQEAADSVNLSSSAIPILNQHADLAQRTVILFSIVAGARLMEYFTEKLNHLGWRVSIFLLGGIGLVSLTLTGDQGARLVFEQGVGVRKVIQTITNENAESNQVKMLNSFEDGSWSWTPVTGSPGQLFEGFQFFMGKEEDLEPASGPDNLLFNVKGPVLFVNNQVLSGVQMDLEFNLDRFNGTVWLIHHAQDQQNYDYLSAGLGKMVLGRIVKGKNKILEEKSITLSGNTTLRVVGSGKHFRGYLNGELVLHGHAGGQPAGFTGLKIEGTGSLGISKLVVSVLH